jgi:ADP-dependent NAD(P)H-hydrate dehydratase / NAD(P)H-hydrate epimerase
LIFEVILIQLAQMNRKFGAKNPENRQNLKFERGQMLKAVKVVTAAEMARIETLAYEDGFKQEQFMEQAGESVAKHVDEFIQEHALEKKVCFIAGKGNNAGDGFAALCFLLDKGYTVTAWHIFPPTVCSLLCQKMRERFQKKAGVIHTVSNTASIHFEGVILEGLVGTGFKGKAEGILANTIESANHSGLPILSIDIPAGLNGSTGEVGSVAIHATKTIFLEFPKLGFFQNEGWNHVGKLVMGHFGLDKKYKAKANPCCYLFDTSSLSCLLPPLKRTRHKYEAGYVLAFAGSKQMPGAALLASQGALRAGCGIVRLFHPPHMEAELSFAPYELIKESWTTKSLIRLREESKRAKSMLIGPGMGRSSGAKQMIKQLLKETKLPTVIDADALYFLAENPSWKLPKEAILTPHHGEMQRLLSTFKGKSEAQAFADAKGVTLVLKGAPTFIYHPQSLPLIIGHGDPGMATAGSGDVLTGILAAMLAQGLDTKSAACVSVALHAIAGEISADFLTSYCMTASDILHFLPMAFSRAI